ncbi:MAG TPA: hypothetical protein VFS00_26025, partial [Polyangiaceae bacterium]|nr:hypothetical protein [Polyangiaceae bacterium]
MRRALLAALAALATAGGLAGCHAGAEGVLVPPPGPGKAAPAAANARRRSVERDPAPEFALGGFGACVRVDGRVHCGPLGSEQPLSARPPLAGVDDAVDVALGLDFGCLVRAGGGVACFGSNHYGELGAGLAATESSAPVPVVGMVGATRVFAGQVGACALV